MKKNLAIIGASYLQKPLVLKAKELNIETHVFAWEKEAVVKDIADYFYPISILEKEKILDACSSLNLDGITSIASDIAMPTVNFIADRLNLIGNDLASTGLTTNKFLMRSALKEGGVASPEFVRLKSTKEITGINFENFSFPCVVKPCDRSGSRGVELVHSKNELESASAKALEESFAKELILEEFVKGKEISVECISFKGQHYFLAATDKKTSGPPHFVEIEQHQPAQLTSKLKNDVIHLVYKALSLLGVEYGASHTEIIITPENHLFIVELGARMGGDFIGSDLVYLSTGFDFLKSTIEVALGIFKEPKTKWNKYSGVYFLSKETEYLKPFFKQKNDNIIKKDLTKEKLTTLTSSSDRSGYLMYQAESKIIL